MPTVNFPLTRPNLIKLLLPLFVFAATFLAVKLIDTPSGNGSAGAGAGASAAGFSDARTTDQRIRSLQAAVKNDTARAAPFAALGDAYLQKARETADPVQYARAESALRAALDRDPRDAGALTAMGSLANARHDFRAGLRYGQRARAAAPGVVKPYGVIVDAQVELGRYGAAERTLQRMVDLKPNLSSYARVSYFRELHGDLPGAIEAMRLAASAGGDTPENLAYVETLIGNLELARGRATDAERAFRLALSRYPGYVPAQAGLARVDASRGELGSAIRRYRAVVTRLPMPEYVVGLAEVELAAGRRAAAREDLALVEVQQRLLRRGGVNVDAEIAIVEADHGSPARAVELARRAYAAAPGVRGADALGWALTRAGRPADGLDHARRALRLGSRDALFLYHAGIAARDAGLAGPARRYLTRALAGDALSPLHARDARTALEAVR
jgi:tetratricopeptide (TPR) repeat protein